MMGMLISCSTTTKNNKRVVVLETPESNCKKIGFMKSSGFSIIPFVGRAMAKSMIESKAKELKANAIVITRNEGFFYSEIDADGFHCREVAQIKI